MQQPLIKVGQNLSPDMLVALEEAAANVGGPSKAFASGVRSCTMKIGDCWYRLKVRLQ
eukprot:SAG31_NODE_29970_length_387_cov_0.715278_1_plen_57_part_01